jgi:hypothetical protein
VKDLLLGKISRLTEEKQVEAMKINLQATGQNTAQLGCLYDFYKSVDIEDLRNEYMKRYRPKTCRCFVSYFRIYADIFFANNPDIELFKLNPHKRSWIIGMFCYLFT